jgi:pimeloyl-ACP methyl ester carboxylesterase
MEPIFGAPRHVPVDGGTIAYEDGGGDGPVVLCLPSLGDVRQEYRLLAPRLRDAGLRVLVADLRGHGDSSTGFSSWGPEAIGADALAVLEHAGVARATIVGCSIAAGAAVWAAAEEPQRVAGLVLIGAFTHDMPADKWFRPLAGLMFARPWGPSLWAAFYARNYGSLAPGDFAEYRRALKAHLGEPGRIEAVVRMVRASKQGVEVRLPSVKARALVLYGEKDLDFPDPAREAAWLKGALGGPSEVTLLPGLGHYPHAQNPDAVAKMVAAHAA